MYGCCIVRDSWCIAKLWSLRREFENLHPATFSLKGGGVTIADIFVSSDLIATSSECSIETESNMNFVCSRPYTYPIATSTQATYISVYSRFFSSRLNPPGPIFTIKSRPPIIESVWKKSYLENPVRHMKIRDV